MNSIIAIANNKGGVGKTATAEYLARVWSKADHTVLVIDCDPQANLTDRLLGEGSRPSVTLADLLDRDATMQDTIIEIDDHLRLIAADTVLEDTDSRMVINNLGIFRLNNILQQYISFRLGTVDIIIIDCPPNLGALTTSALIAADEILIPCLPEPASIAGLEKLVQKQHELRTMLHSAFNIRGSIATMVEATNLHHQYVELLQAHPSVPFLGCVPKRKGENRDIELYRAYDPIAFTIEAQLEGIE